MIVIATSHAREQRIITGMPPAVASLRLTCWGIASKLNGVLTSAGAVCVVVAVATVGDDAPSADGCGAAAACITDAAPVVLWQVVAPLSSTVPLVERKDQS